MCDADVNKKPCKKDPCDLYHPQICRANLVIEYVDGVKRVNLDMYMMVYKEITTGVMQIKHHIIEYTKDLPQLGIPNIKVDMASQTSVIRKVLMLIITADTDNHRNSTDFRMDWLTQREEEMLRKLMYIIQMETGNWGTADRGRPRY